MARTTTTSKVQFTANGATTAFAYSFPMVSASYAVVTLTDLTGVETTQTNPTNYTITVTGTGGTVTFVTAPTNGYMVTIRRVEPITQLSDWSNGAAVSQQTFEDAVDKLTDLSVQLQEQLDRTPKFKLSSTFLNKQFPELVAKKAIRVSDDGQTLVCSTNDFDTLVQDATTQATNAAASAVLASNWASLSGSLVAATDYSAKEWATGTTAQSAKSWATSLALVDGTNYGAKKYANDSASSAAAAAISETNAAGSATAAANSAALVNLPSFVATDYLRVNSAGDAWELRTPAQALADLDGLKASNNLSDLGSASTARSNLGLVIGTNVQAYNANIAVVNANQTWSASQRGTITALTDGATITPDFAVTNDFSVTLGGNRTLANPTNITVGQKGVFVVSQDGTGSRTLAFGSYYKWAGGTAPTLTTTASAVDRIQYHVVSSTAIHCSFVGDMK